MVTLTTDLHPTGVLDIWSGYQISSSLSTRISIQMDDDGCPLNTQQFLQPTLILQELVPVWENGFHNWSQILGQFLDNRPYFLVDRELI